MLGNSRNWGNNFKVVELSSSRVEMGWTDCESSASGTEAAAADLFWACEEAIGVVNDELLIRLVRLGYTDCERSA